VDIIWIPGRGVGKARPRFTRYGTYMPQRYLDWQTAAISWIKQSGIQPYKVPVEVKCKFVNFFSSDSDNLVGAVIDALVKAEVLQNDSSSFVTGQSGNFCKVYKLRGVEKPVGILVQIIPKNIEELEYDEFLGLLGENKPKTQLIQINHD